MNVTQRAIEAAGGNQAVADKIGVTMPTVWRWGDKDKFKGRHVKTLCEMTGGDFTPQQLRPDIFGDATQSDPVAQVMV